MKIGYHLKGFFPIWLCLLALCVATFFAWMGNWEVAKVIGGISLLAVVALLVIKPMNVVYGLMGTTGNIRHFFLNFILIEALTFKPAVLFVDEHNKIIRKASYEHHGLLSEQ